MKALEGATKDQASSELWRSQRRFRFTASNFYLISHRQRNHQNFANTLIHPKAFTSRHTSHGIKYEPEAIHAYMKHMNNRSIPVDVYKCGLVVSQKELTLAWTPDGKVIDPGCKELFGLLEVKCPETKFLVTPLEAFSDSNFCCENVDGQCKLKLSLPYYAQVQGQIWELRVPSGVILWCTLRRECQLERIPWDPRYGHELEGKLLFYYYDHFIDFAILEAL